MRYNVVLPILDVISVAWKLPTKVFTDLFKKFREACGRAGNKAHISQVTFWPMLDLASSETRVWISRTILN